MTREVHFDHGRCRHNLPIGQAKRDSHFGTGGALPFQNLLIELR